MELQRLGGFSDREAVEQYSFDARWRYATGVGGYAGSSAGAGGFVHTVLVDMRARLRRLSRPDRIFEVGLTAAAEAGWSGGGGCWTSPVAMRVPSGDHASALTRSCPPEASSAHRPVD